VPLLLSARRHFFELKERARSRVRLDDYLRPVRPAAANALRRHAANEAHQEQQNDRANRGADDLADDPEKFK
jgi:hypothetical protein